MAKFKPGDRARIVKCESKMFLGAEVTIVRPAKASDQGDWAIDLNSPYENIIWCAFEYQLEPIQKRRYSSDYEVSEYSADGLLQILKHPSSIEEKV